MMEEKQLTAEATKITVLGMSLRDWYAGQAMQAIITSPHCNVERSMQSVAEDAFNMANEMMKRRKEP